ncbi:MAG: hypothetical protein ACR2J4_08995 [Deinococcus sp.]
MKTILVLTGLTLADGALAAPDPAHPAEGREDTRGLAVNASTSGGSDSINRSVDSAVAPAPDTDSAQFRNIRKSAGCSSMSQNPYFFLLPLVGSIPQTTRI